MRHGAQPFVLPLSTLIEGRNDVRLEGDGEDAGIEPADATIDGSVRIEGDFYRVGDHVEVQARVRVAVNLTCDRCLAPVVGKILAPVRLFCEKREVRDRRTEAEVKDEDVGLLYHDGRTLDLREEIRSVILLEVPWHPLCKPDCRGLCPRCGKNLNEGDCVCPRDRGASPWHALRHAVEGEPPASDAPRGKKE
jgi:uncharacterized protein